MIGPPRRVLLKPLAALPRDGWLLLGLRAVRLWGIGFTSIILAVHFAALGLAPATIGLIFTAALAGSVVLTLAVTVVGDRVGRRRLLALSGFLMALSGVTFALTDVAWLLLVAAFVGVMSPSGSDVGSSLALEQATLAQVVRPADRTAVFAWGNLVASLASAIGALAAGLPALAQQVGLGVEESYRLMLWAYALIGAGQSVLAARLSPAVEVRADDDRAPRWLALHRSRGLIARFAALLAVNAFAAGFVAQSLVAYWFHVTFGADAATLGAVFFLTNVAGALSYLVAVPIAARIGLVNTMVWTHLPSNLLLMLVPLMPTLTLAAAVLVARHALSQMDRPARESYTMAIVAPNERTAAAGVISIATDAAGAVALAIAGATAQLVAPGALFVVAGLGRCAYNGALFVMFRHVRPSEQAAVARGRPGE